MRDNGPDLVRLVDAGLLRDGRSLWRHLELRVTPGEFVAILGPNGAGKTSLLQVLLGRLRLSEGSVTVAGRPPRLGSERVGYLPQQRGFDREVGLRGSDLVGLGLDGHRYGRPWSGRTARRKVQGAIDAVGARSYAHLPVGELSGGEQQRLRIAQALVGDPDLLLCDEPLLSLDLNHQRAVVELIDARRRTAGTGVLLVTHELNPVLPVVDRVVYLVAGRWASGTPEEVMTSDRLSELYDSPVDVVRVRDRLVVVGGDRL